MTDRQLFDPLLPDVRGGITANTRLFAAHDGTDDGWVDVASISGGVTTYDPSNYPDPNVQTPDGHFEQIDAGFFAIAGQISALATSVSGNAANINANDADIAANASAIAANLASIGINTSAILANSQANSGTVGVHSDVDLTTAPVAGDTLVWDAVDGAFKPAAPTATGSLNYLEDYDGSSAVFPTSTSSGDIFRISNAPAPGIALGSTNTVVVTNGDLLISIVDNASDSDGADWHHLNLNQHAADVVFIPGAAGSSVTNLDVQGAIDELGVIVDPLINGFDPGTVTAGGIVGPTIFHLGNNSTGFFQPRTAANALIAGAMSMAAGNTEVMRWNSFGTTSLSGLGIRLNNAANSATATVSFTGNTNYQLTIPAAPPSAASPVYMTPGGQLTVPKVSHSETLTHTGSGVEPFPIPFSTHGVASVKDVNVWLVVDGTTQNLAAAPVQRDPTSQDLVIFIDWPQAGTFIAEISA